MTPQPTFLFATCQVGAERALKAEIAARWPTFHFAFSRPGFLTYKLPAGFVAEDFELGAVFARTHGLSLGKVGAKNHEEAARAIWELVGSTPYDRLHVWQRDAARPGYRGFEPGISSVARDADVAIRAARPAAFPDQTPLIDKPASAGQTILDCVIVEPDEWWIGYHRAGDRSTCWPGGVPSEIALPEHAVSRAYLKMMESLEWSGLPAKAGDAWVELGAAPGGASQALLDRGFLVTGVDPAEVDPRVVAHPNFQQIRKRGADVRRREYRNFRFLAADMNVAPEYTLDTVEAIVTHSAVHVRGLLLTLKLLEWQLAAEIPQYLARVRGWGYRWVRARQLAHNRQEICVAAALVAPDREKAPGRRRRPAKRTK